MYNCSHVPLFELGSLHHDFYLLNVRLPVDMLDTSEKTGMNTKLGHINDMWVAVSLKAKPPSVGVQACNNICIIQMLM